MSNTILGKARTICVICCVAGAMTACTKPGDFCDVSEPFIFNDEAADVISFVDPGTGNKLVEHNLYGIENCPAGWWPG